MTLLRVLAPLLLVVATRIVARHAAVIVGLSVPDPATRLLVGFPAYAAHPPLVGCCDADSRAEWSASRFGPSTPGWAALTGRVAVVGVPWPAGVAAPVAAVGRRVPRPGSMPRRGAHRC